MKTFWIDVTLKVMAPDEELAIALVQDSIVDVVTELYPEQVKVIGIEVDTE